MTVAEPPATIRVVHWYIRSRMQDARYYSCVFMRDFTKFPFLLVPSRDRNFAMPDASEWWSPPNLHTPPGHQQESLLSVKDAQSSLIQYRFTIDKCTFASQ